MVYVLMANGFEETELVVPLDILRRGGANVCVVGVEGACAESTRGVKLIADRQLDELSFSDMEMLVLPGGQPGVDHLWADERVRNLIVEAAKKKVIIGAICAAPMLLGRMELLNNKKATCYPGCETDMLCAQMQDACVVTDGRVITARGAGAAFRFGLALLEALKGEKTAQQVAKNMQYRGHFHG